MAIETRKLTLTLSAETFERAMNLADLYECSASELFELLVDKAAEELEPKEH